MKKVEDFEIYTQGRILIKNVYELTNKGKFIHDRSLSDQMRRAAVSILSNLMEGYERDSKKELNKFLGYSKGSCAELKVQIIIANDIGYIKEDIKNQLTNECSELMRMLGGYRKYLANKSI